MNIIISAQTDAISGAVDERFGRCRWMIKFDTGTSQWQAFENPGLTASGGAGIAAAQFVVEQNAEAVISGDFGPNAAEALRAGNIAMYRLGEGIVTVQDAVDAFSQNKLLKSL